MRCWNWNTPYRQQVALHSSAPKSEFCLQWLSMLKWRAQICCLSRFLLDSDERHCGAEQSRALANKELHLRAGVISWRRFQLSLGCVQPISWDALTRSLHFGDDHRCTSHLLLLLFLLLFLLLLRHAVLQLCLHSSLAPWQQKVNICIRHPTRREGVAHGLDQAKDCSQERQHWAHQVDLQQAPTGLLAHHLSDKGHQLL